MPLSHSLHAHCPICGNLALKRISPEYVNSMTGDLWRLLHIPAFRCEPCRHKYFSILPLHETQENEVGVPSGD
jgi:YgiT-type zinc finger domain-containing protein